MKNETPQKVKESARFLIDMYGDNVEFIGKYQDSDVYQYMFPEGEKTGFPFVFLYNHHTGDVQKITGFDSFDIIDVAEGLDK
jgi:hypothetical protein